MKISYNPKSSLAAITPLTAANDDIIFDLYASKLWAKGVRIGADWADISSKPSSLKNPYALTISLNGTSQGPYDGSAAKNINITPGSIGAAVSNHNHDYLIINKANEESFNSAYHNFLVLYASGSNGITGRPPGVDAFGLIKLRAAEGWSGQMLLANGGSLYIRSSVDALMTNTLAWKTILDSSNYSGILDSRYYTESEVNNLLSRKLDRVNLTTGSWNPRGYNLAADYYYNGGDLSISENGGKMYVSIDGLFYQNDGLYRVLDTSDVAGLKNNLTVHLFLSNTDTTWYPLIWGGDSHNNTSDSTGIVYKSYDKLSWLTSSLTLYATHLKTTDLNTLTALFHPDNDSTLKIYSGKITDGKSDGNICLLTSIDGTDGLSHTYPTQYGARCNLVLQPRGGQVYIGTNPDGGNTAYKLYVNGGVYASSFTGNASSATRLLTARTINGTIFNGTSDITTTYWGATRTISLTGAVTGSVSTNGSGNITINTTYGTGNITNLDNRYLKKTGDTMSGTLSFSPTDSSDAAPKIYSTVSDGLTSLNFEVSDDANDRFVFKINNWNDTNTANRERFIIEWNNVISKAPITAPSFNGNATSATKLQTARLINGTNFDGSANITTSYWGTARTFTIGNTAKNVDGSGNVSWSLSEIGASPSGHNHDNIYIKKVGDMPIYNDIIISPTNLSEEGIDGGGGIHVKGFTGTPFLLWLHDTGNVWYKKTGDGAWKKMDAGHADTAGSVAWNNITGKPSSFTPSAHTHAWNSLTHSSTIENQAILTNGEANGWKLLTLNIANWDNAANNAHSHSNKSVLDGITSGLVTNWNTAYNFVSTITGEDADKVINKWDEIVNFLAGITEDNKLNTLLNSKLSVYELANNTNVGTIKNNGIYYSTTDASSGTLTNSPFNTGFALINMTSYDGGDDLRRSRLAFNAHGEIKVSDDRNLANTAETWYDVLTSKNSGISGSTIKLNGTSITVYSSSAADGRYVKKTGDTMTGALNFANNAWNNVGDDVAIGDHNVAGCLGIKGLNADPGLVFYNSSNTLLSKLVGTTNLFLRVSGNNIYNILDTSTTLVSDGKGIINGTTITQVDNADKLDGYHENSFLRYRGATSTDLEATLWNLIGIKTYLNALPDGLTGVYSYGSVISLSGAHSRFEIYASHKSSSGNGLYYRSGWDVDKNSWLKFIDSSNIGSLSVNYANSAGNADTLDNYHANGLLTALYNSNNGISITVGGTTKSVNNISVNYASSAGNADTVDRYHANTVYNAPSFNVSNGNTSNTYILLATITISGTSLACAEFTTLFQNRECLDNSSFILSGAIRRNSTTDVTATLSYITLHTKTPKNIYLRSDDGVTFLVYIQSVAGSWTTYYRAIPIVDSGNIAYSNTGTTSPISGSVLNITATKGGNVNYANSAGSADTATKLTSSAGNAALPIYFLDGKPVACTAASVFSNLSNSGNNLSITVAGQNRTLTVGYATSAGSATKVIVNLHTANDINYPLVWSNLNNVNNATENQLFKSWLDLYYNPKNKRLFVGGSVSTSNINATGTVASAGFKHSAVTENADLYVLTAGGGYTFLNLTSNELAHEFSKDITVTSEWTDIEDFYGGNLNFLTLPGTYIVLVYYNDNSADGMYEGYFSGIMSWFTGTTNSNNADEIVLHRVGHAYANTIYLRTRESLESETNPYTKLQISANTTLKQHTYKFKFKRIC